MCCKYLLTIAVNTAGNEQLFSVLKRDITYLRTTTGDDRLCSLMLMATEQRMFKSFDLEELVDDFAHMKHRRCTLYCKQVAVAPCQNEISDVQ